MIKQKSADSSYSIAAGIGIGVGVSMLMTLILTAVLALLISREYLAESSLGVSTIVIQLISSLVGAWIAYRQIKSKRLAVCLGAALGYFLLLLGCTALFFNGQYQGVGGSAVAILIGGLTVGLLGLKDKKQSRVNRRIIKNR